VAQLLRDPSRGAKGLRRGSSSTHGRRMPAPTPGGAAASGAEAPAPMNAAGMAGDRQREQRARPAGRALSSPRTQRARTVYPEAAVVTAWPKPPDRSPDRVGRRPGAVPRRRRDVARASRDGTELAAARGGDSHGRRAMPRPPFAHDARVVRARSHPRRLPAHLPAQRALPNGGGRVALAARGERPLCARRARGVGRETGMAHRRCRAPRADGAKPRVRRRCRARRRLQPRAAMAGCAAEGPHGPTTAGVAVLAKLRLRR